MIYLHLMYNTMNHISKFIRLFVVLLIVFSIGANGAFAGQRVEKAAQKSAISVLESKFVQGPPSPDDAPLNMETSSLPVTEQQAYLKAPQILHNDKTLSRFKLYKQHSKKLLQEFLNAHNEKFLIVTTSQVHSKLGRLFRLVGAKPSGTS